MILYAATVQAPTAIDLFAGAGGATEGLRQAGFDVVAAIENDPDAAATYRLNHPNVRLSTQDIRVVEPSDLGDDSSLRSPTLGLLKACPPCQGFSSLARGDVDEVRNDLVLDVQRFVNHFSPKVVLLENVPGLNRDARKVRLLEHLENAGYESRTYVVDAKDFGVPQRRKRLIILATRSDIQRAPEDIFGIEGVRGCRATVGDAFDRLAVNIQANDPLNVSRKSRPVTSARIRQVPTNGTRFDLPETHQLDCHRRLAVDGKIRRVATSSYGRMIRDEPAPTMTTRCTTPACGRFIHPSEHRGITLREAASIQTFPYSYGFVGGYDSIERQIGNAVPVRMAHALGLVVRSLITTESD